MSAGEDEITAWFARQADLSAARFPIGIGDDMAQVRFGDESVFITTDMLLDGVHFELSKVTLQQAGYKAMAVSLSDCAAMAVVPVAAVASVALPEGFGEDELKKLHRGLTAAAGKFDCALVGGDITSWQRQSPFAISVTVLACMAATEPVKRSGARVGDSICVTGSLGGAGCGKHLKFEPRVKEALKLAEIVKLNSMIDISDGLSSDLNRICAQSGTGALLEAQSIPVSEEARAKADPLSSALNDGEDFELLFTLSEGDCSRLLDEWNEPVPVTRIGQVTERRAIQIKMPDGRTVNLEPGGYDHLAD
jgi:thiamine-monophosphate kinase